MLNDCDVVLQRTLLSCRLTLLEDGVVDTVGRLAVRGLLAGAVIQTLGASAKGGFLRDIQEATGAPRALGRLLAVGHNLAYGQTQQVLYAAGQLGTGARGAAAGVGGSGAQGPRGVVGRRGHRTHQRHEPGVRDGASGLHRTQHNTTLSPCQLFSLTVSMVHLPAQHITPFLYYLCRNYDKRLELITLLSHYSNSRNH